MPDSPSTTRKETDNDREPSPAGGSSASQRSPLAGAGLTACTGVAPATSSAGGGSSAAAARTTLRAVHLRGRHDHRPASRPRSRSSTSRTAPRPRSTTCPARARRCTRTSCAPSCSAAAGPTSGASGAARSARPSSRPSRPSTSRRTTQVRLGHARSTQNAIAGMTFDGVKGGVPFFLAGIGALVQQGRLREGGHGRRAQVVRRAGGGERQAGRGRHHPAAAWAASTAGTSCGSSSTCSRQSAGPELHDKLLTGAESWDRPEVVTAFTNFKKWQDKKWLPRGRARPRSRRRRAAVRAGQDRVHDHRPVDRGERHPSRQEDVRRLRRRSSCRPTRRRPATPASSRAT